MKQSSKSPAYRHYRVLFEFGSFSGLSDGELLDRFVNRDDEAAEFAFAALVDRHASKVLRICRAIVRNEHDAEDAFQATFLVLATKAARLKARESLAPWLSAVARRVASGARAAAIARAAREQRAAGDRLQRSGSDAIDGDVSAVLYEEIERLPERYRLPLVLCDLQSQSHQEAARRLGWPLGTVKSRQARGRQRLRARLTRRGVSGTVGLLSAAGAARSSIAGTGAQIQVPASLIHSTAQIAAAFVSRETAAQAVSASVSTLVAKTLRAMIMTRMSRLIGVFLTISVGVVATVLAQAPVQGPRTTPPANGFRTRLDQPPPTAASKSPVYECEIRIWKDGAPVTATMKVRALPGETSHFTIPDGTFDLRFKTASDATEATTTLERAAGALTELLASKNAAEKSNNLASVISPTEMQKKAVNDERLKTLLEAKLNEAAGAQTLAELVAKLHPVELAELGTRLQVPNEFLTKPATGQPATANVGTKNGSNQPAGTQPPDQTTGEKSDHERRLREIELKLEQILNALDRQQPTGTQPRPR